MPASQAEGDCGGKPWIVAHRRNHAPWLITMRAETFFNFLRGEFPLQGMRRWRKFRTGEQTNRATKANRAINV